MGGLRSVWRRAAWAAALASGVLGAPAVADGLLAPVAAAGSAPPAPWRVVGMPAQRKPLTRFEAVDLEGARVLRVQAERSYGNLVHETRVDSGGPHLLAWRWRVDEGLPDADLSRRAAEDVPVRVCALFDLPLANVPFLERQLLRVVRAGVADDPPSASVCYVWNARLPPGSALASPFTRRIRYIVLRGAETPLHEWRSERRDLWADFLALFGDESRVVPPLVGVAVGADADNTRGHSLGHVADLDLR